MTIVTSLQNPRVKALVRLQDKAAERRERGVVVIEGGKEIGLAREAGLTFEELFHCPALGPLPADLRAAVPEVTEVTRDVFAKIAYRDDSDGLVAIARAPERTLASALIAPPRPPLVLVLDAVEKPGNLGAIVRTADGVGADLVLVCDPRCDAWNPNVVRASVGTVFRVPVVATTAAEARAFLRARGVRLVAATPDGALDLWDAPAAVMTGPVALCLGTEHEGLDPGWLDAADVRVKIPMRGRNDSLNVSVAAAVLAYEVLRRRRP